MERHSENAQRLAVALQDLPGIRRVIYPGLSSHPGHYIAAIHMPCGFGSMVSIELEGGHHDPCEQSPEILEAHSVTAGLVRLSVGLENIADLLADVVQVSSKNRVRNAFRDSPASMID
jgi:cystathionine beta-lyase/cystathionine gamma-synthase